MGDNGEREYTDMKWYGVDFAHSTYGIGCHVVQVALDGTETPDKQVTTGCYTALHFHTEDGNWHEFKQWKTATLESCELALASCVSHWGVNK